jgi:uncharacterized protein (UPF0332 family)
MSQIKDKVKWCLKKAMKELAESKKHRGLIRINPSKVLAREHIFKAEHYLEATFFLKEKFSDISASTVFYSIYHCFLAILAKYGYESRNQECTFAVIYALAEAKEIDIDKSIIDKISLFSIKDDEDSVIEIREKYQYGVELSMKEELYNENVEIAKKILGKTKEIIEK